MAGTRRDGILQVDDNLNEGGAVGVEGDVVIISPIGVKPSGSSVSVAIASDQLPLPVDISAAGTVEVIVTNIPIPISGTVNIANPVEIVDPVTVNAVALDTRRLSFEEDKVDVSNSVVSATVINDVLVIEAVDLDVRALDFATDKVDVSGSVVQVQQPIEVTGALAINDIVQVVADDLDIRELKFATDQVDVSGSVVSVNNIPTSSIAKVTSVTGQPLAVTILAANPLRKGYKLFNDSDKVAYVKEGTFAGYTDFSYKIQPDWFYESVGLGSYTGVITAIWTSATAGAMRVTELE
jgi:hypothetical protein